ncbi:unnamed protein product [Heterobilharzia americana]|nr:unnamed protein product [Heterobilharzia americana]CAH8539221.1 unnamed protein product [Heterobilharzia americana]
MVRLAYHNDPTNYADWNTCSFNILPCQNGQLDSDMTEGSSLLFIRTQTWCSKGTKKWTTQSNITRLRRHKEKGKMNGKELPLYFKLLRFDGVQGRSCTLGWTGVTLVKWELEKVGLKRKTLPFTLKHKGAGDMTSWSDSREAKRNLRVFKRPCVTDLKQLSQELRHHPLTLYLNVPQEELAFHGVGNREVPTVRTLSVLYEDNTANYPLYLCFLRCFHFLIPI